MNEASLPIDEVARQIASGQAKAHVVREGEDAEGVGRMNGGVARMRITDASDPNRPTGPGYLALPRHQYLSILESVDADRAKAARQRNRSPFLARMRARRDRRKREEPRVHG